MKERARSVAAALLAPVRRRWGRRVVNWTPDFMGFGNHLYLWTWAHAGRAGELERRVLITDKMRPWAAQVPDFARAHLVNRTDVRLLDQRDHVWARPEEHSGDPRGFTQESREAFIRECLLPSPLLAGVGGPLGEDDVLTINARRGDYYSNAAHRPLHAIDLPAYLRLAVRGSVARDGAVRRVHLVSDDIPWCRRELGFLADVAAEVTFADPADPPEQNFRDVCSARRLVLSNSTFSMWGAFVGRVLHGDDPGKTWAPAFFMSSYGPGRCYEYDQDWSFVDELPDGWQPDRVVAVTG